MSKIVKTIDGHQGELLYIKGNTVFIKESNGEVWYCPKTDVVDEISERDRMLDTIVEMNDWNYKKDKIIEDLQSQLDQQKAMWQELKEWLNDRMECYDNCLNENVLISSEREEVLCARHNQCYETIAQMEYIEKEYEK